MTIPTGFGYLVARYESLDEQFYGNKDILFNTLSLAVVYLFMFGVPESSIIFARFAISLLAIPMYCLGKIAYITIYALSSE